MTAKWSYIEIIALEEVGSIDFPPMHKMSFAQYRAIRDVSKGKQPRPMDAVGCGPHILRWRHGPSELPEIQLEAKKRWLSQDHEKIAAWEAQEAESM